MSVRTQERETQSRAVAPIRRRVGPWIAALVALVAIGAGVWTMTAGGETAVPVVVEGPAMDHPTVSTGPSADTGSDGLTRGQQAEVDRLTGLAESEQSSDLVPRNVR